MKKILFVVAALVVSAPAFAADKAAEKAAEKPAAKTATSKDDAVKAVLAGLDAAIGKHDAKAVGELFAEDGTFVAPMGDAKVVKGKAELLKHHEMMFQGPMKDATVKHTVENIRWIGKDAALVDCSVEMTGVKMDMPAGAPMPLHHATLLLTMKGGKWLVADARPYAVMPVPPAAPAKM